MEKSKIQSANTLPSFQEKRRAACRGVIEECRHGFSGIFEDIKKEPHFSSWSSRAYAA